MVSNILIDLIEIDLEIVIIDIGSYPESEHRGLWDNWNSALDSGPG